MYTLPIGAHEGEAACPELIENLSELHNCFSACNIENTGVAWGRGYNYHVLASV